MSCTTSECRCALQPAHPVRGLAASRPRRGPRPSGRMISEGVHLPQARDDGRFCGGPAPLDALTITAPPPSSPDSSREPERVVMSLERWWSSSVIGARFLRERLVAAYAPPT